MKTAGLLRLEQSDLEMSLSAAKFMHLKNSKVKTEEYLISISHLPRLLWKVPSILKIGSTLKCRNFLTIDLTSQSHLYFFAVQDKSKEVIGKILIDFCLRACYLYIFTVYSKVVISVYFFDCYSIWDP